MAGGELGVIGNRVCAANFKLNPKAALAITSGQEDISARSVAEDFFHPRWQEA